MPELLPVDVHRILYLDVDCIVTGDLSPLLETDLGSFLLAGVRNIGAQETEALDTPDYVNGGVMLINLDAWRREDIALAAARYARDQKPKLHDQTAINVITVGRKMLLASEWNLMTSQAGRPDWRQLVPEVLPRIVHFNGSSKPWEYSDAILGEIYRVHREATPFPLPPLRQHRSTLGIAIRVALRRKGYFQRHEFNKCFQRSFVEPYLAKLRSLM